MPHTLRSAAACLALSLLGAAGPARADALSELAADTLAFSEVGQVARAHGGWSSRSSGGAVRFALPDPRGFVWAGVARRGKGAPESSPAESIELFAPESGSAAGEAFPLLSDQSAQAFGADAPSKFSAIATCKAGALESQVGSVVEGPGRRPLSLRSSYAPNPVMFAWIGARAVPPARRSQANALAAIEALRAAAGADPDAAALIAKLQGQAERSRGPARMACPTASSAQAWPAPFSKEIDARQAEAAAMDPKALAGLFGSPQPWRPEPSFDAAGKLALLDILADMDDQEAEGVEEAARAALGPPQGASMGFDHGTPELFLSWSMADGTRANLKYHRSPSQARGSAVFSLEPAGSKLAPSR